jgi:hypothetical protein
MYAGRIVLIFILYRPFLIPHSASDFPVQTTHLPLTESVLFRQGNCLFSVSIYSTNTMIKPPFAVHGFKKEKQ